MSKVLREGVDYRQKAPGIQMRGCGRALYFGRIWSKMGSVWCMNFFLWILLFMNLLGDIYSCSFFFLCQEPIIQSEQPPCARFTAFLRTSLFFNGFGANFEYLLNPTNRSAKPTDLKLIFFAF